MNVKNILTSLGMIVFVGAVVAGATGAFFSDTETSTGNVFTAGDVSLTLAGLTHTYLASADVPANYWTMNSETNSFQFLDLKPLDWGVMEGKLTNEGNPSFVCARITDKNEMTPFKDLLRFRVNQGLGLTFGQMTGVPLNTWFSLDPSNTTLAMADGGIIDSGLEYCFGKFLAGDPNDPNVNGDCILDPDVTEAQYNLAQNQTLTLDIEYYAVQQRNNEGFTCEGMNPLNDPEINTLSNVEIPATITVEDLGDSIKWTIDIDETLALNSNGHHQYGLVISKNGINPTYQIHSNDGTDANYPWGTHLYSPWGPSGTGFNGWHTSTTNTPVSSLNWVIATGKRDITENPGGLFTVTIKKTELAPTFYWGVMTGGNATSYYPATWAVNPWGENASTLQPYNL